MTAFEQSKTYAENADYFKQLLDASRDHIRPAYAAKFEAIVTASLAAAEAYAKLAKASLSEEATARLAANQCAMEVEKAKAAFAEVL
jgi:hypothetical protein